MKFEVSLGLLRLLARRWDPTCWIGLEPLQFIPISHPTPAHTGLGLGVFPPAVPSRATFLLPTEGDFAFLWGQARTQSILHPETERPSREPQRGRGDALLEVPCPAHRCL